MQPHESTELEYVGFWARTGAALIDSILVMIVVLPLLYAIYGAAYWDSTAMVMGPADFIINWLLPAAFVLALWIKLSATPGRVDWPGPALGEHNAAVFRELLGIDEAELSRLGECGVV